jgi:hypothetical protein
VLLKEVEHWIKILIQCHKSGIYIQSQDNGKQINLASDKVFAIIVLCTQPNFKYNNIDYCCAQSFIQSKYKK